jgi:hypothetical protein
MRPVQPEELRSPRPPESVRVTLADHSTVVVYAPRVVGDTLVGVTIYGARQHFLVSRTTTIQAREAAPDRTAGLVLLSASGVLALAIYLVERPPTPPPPGYCPPGVECTY